MLGEDDAEAASAGAVASYRDLSNVSHLNSSRQSKIQLLMLSMER